MQQVELAAVLFGHVDGPVENRVDRVGEVDRYQDAFDVDGHANSLRIRSAGDKPEFRRGAMPAAAARGLGRPGP